MHKSIIFLSVLTITFVGCNTTKKATTGTPVNIPITSVKVDKPQTITTVSDLKYTITSKGNGPLAHKGDNVKVHYTGKLTNDTIFDSSIPRGTPFEFPLGRGKVIKGWDEGISYLHVGDKATFVIPPSIGYGERETGPIPGNSTLLFDVELVDTKPGNIKSFEIKNHDTLTTACGLKYLIVQSNPKGEKPETGGKVTMNYIAYFLDGNIFDASADWQKPFSFLLGKRQVIEGWDEGVALMRKGEKYRFIIPYHHAYGEQGYQVIPPKSTLVFDIELLDVKKPIKAVPYDVTGKQTVTTESGLKYIVISKGTGPKVESGKTVRVHYTGYSDDGKTFDSSIERDEPIEFPVGQGKVIKGWDEGLLLMNVGDKMRLIIPANLAYGEKGSPPVIAPNAQLTFDVEMVEVKP